MLDRALHLDASLLQPFSLLYERARFHRHREVHVRAAFVAELLLPGRPQTESPALSDGQPDPLVVARDQIQPERVGVEARERIEVACAQRDLAESGDHAATSSSGRGRSEASSSRSRRSARSFAFASSITSTFAPLTTARRKRSNANGSMRSACAERGGRRPSSTEVFGEE